MKLQQVFLIVFLLLTNIVYTQTDCACCTEYHNQFDFWLGDWVVYDTDGNLVGENLVVKLEENCVVSERWKGTTGGTGRSYNYFDDTDSTWNQVWIDSKGKNLVLKGHAESNQMILESQLIEGSKVDWYRNRISWTNNPDGTVTQTWEVLDKDGQPLAVAFEGIYKRR